MRWDRSHESSDIEDRRGEPGAGGFGGGLPLGGILAIASRFGWKGILIALVVIGALTYRGGLCGGGEVSSIAKELQADCIAGAWAKDAQRRDLLEVGDVDEALNAASQIGDDTIQRKTQGRVQPETWTHGSAAQRSSSFKKGLEGG